MRTAGYLRNTGGLLRFNWPCFGEPVTHRVVWESPAARPTRLSSHFCDAGVESIEDDVLDLKAPLAVLER